MKKLISIILISVFVSSQLGCGNKVLTTPLNRAQFDSNYTYDIHAVQNTELPSVPGSNIQNFGDRIHVTQNNQTKYLLHNQIQSIDGESNQAVNSQALNGLAMGAGIGGVSMAIFANAVPCLFCDDEYEDYSVVENTMMGLVIGGLLGGILGLGIGAMIPQKQKVQIIPYISPTTQGVSGGANIGMKF